MDTFVNQFISRYANHAILIDTNILLLRVVGSVDKNLVPRFKRTKQFAADDFDTLERLLSYLPRIVTTPNILTEVSNLASQLSGPAKRKCFLCMAERISFLDETFVASGQVMNRSEFARLGLTDTVILELSKRTLGVVTDDSRLAMELTSLGIDTLNFNHIRPGGWS